MSVVRGRSKVGDERSGRGADQNMGKRVDHIDCLFQ
jgi:hypothetical protein